MKFATLKTVALGMGLLVGTSAFAADPIVGKWKMSEDGQEKAIVTISQSGNGYVGVMTKGLTEKAKKSEGKTILTGLTAQGGGKYKGKGVHPTLGVKGTVNVTVSGNKITIKSITGTQTGVKQ